MSGKDHSLYICIGLGLGILILVAYQVNVNRKQQSEIDNIKEKTNHLENHMKVLADAMTNNLQKTSILENELSYNRMNESKKSTRRGKKKKTAVQTDIDLVSAALG